MKHYNFNEIKNAGSCIDYVEQILGGKVTANRCTATWRNGERDSVRVEKDRWFDHATQQGGGLVELCAVSKFGGTGAAEIQKAQEFLGDWLHLDKMKLSRAPGKKKSRYDELLADGYTEKARYEYRDLDGKLIYFVCRMEHPTRKKEFVQGTPTRWGISNITPIPYNWKTVHESEWCCIVEGEKDVETLKKLGVPATTNSGGAKKWKHAFSEYLRGKRVVILPDNDDISSCRDGVVRAVPASAAHGAFRQEPSSSFYPRHWLCCPPAAQQGRPGHGGPHRPRRPAGTKKDVHRHGDRRTSCFTDAARGIRTACRAGKRWPRNRRPARRHCSTGHGSGSWPGSCARRTWA